MTVNYSKAGVKSLIKVEMIKKWQEGWNTENKGRVFYSNQMEVGRMREKSRSKKEEDTISRMRFGHTGLNSMMKVLRKHETGMCELSNYQETVEHVIINCPKYQRQRRIIKARLSREQIRFNITEILQPNSGHLGHRAIFDILCIIIIIIRVCYLPLELKFP